MKRFATLALLVLTAAVGGLFFIETPDGRPILTMRNG